MPIEIANTLLFGDSTFDAASTGGANDPSSAKSLGLNVCDLTPVPPEDFNASVSLFIVLISTSFAGGGETAPNTPDCWLGGGGGGGGSGGGGGGGDAGGVTPGFGSLRESAGVVGLFSALSGMGAGPVGVVPFMSIIIPYDSTHNQRVCVDILSILLKQPA